jgi:tripartite-type tricarboxylate transporter receptor subunit TctC
MSRAIARALVAPMLVALCTATAHADTPAEFYNGKSVDLYIGYSTGGGYDLYGRLLARHLGKHIPGNPAVVAKNMDGAASLTLANWLYKTAPKDGTVLGTIGRGTALDPILGVKGAQFVGTKFTWIGSANNEVSVCVVWSATGIAKFEDLLDREISVGATGASDDTVQFAKLLNAVLGSKLKIVTGYGGGNDVTVALERGEVQGRCGWSWSSLKATRPTWMAEKKINVLMQLSLEKHEDLPDVRLATDVAKTDEQKQILKLFFARQVMGRPFLAPPGIPADRAQALQKAFMDTMHDPDFLADARKSRLDINPVSGEKLDALMREMYETPPEIARKAADALR